MAKAATTRRKPAAAKPVVEEVVEEPKQWTMPPVCRGQAVTFYYRGTTNRKNADVGFVASVGEKSVAINYRGNTYGDVIHLEDPRLKVNPELLKEMDGLWDYSDETIKQEQRLQELEARIAKLEKE